VSEQEERSGGPLEEEIHELVRLRGTSDPDLLRAQFSGREPTLEEWVAFLQRQDEVLLEALLRLAREIDDLRASG